MKCPNPKGCRSPLFTLKTSCFESEHFSENRSWGFKNPRKADLAAPGQLRVTDSRSGCQRGTSRHLSSSIFYPLPFILWPPTSRP